ncbi:hypothetical protein BaRGS_00026275 [Batillaria attramentaria]|uniref:Uncharacterized protein n=1 Tax=Batillaria attramentaria TaxID=370345 RepID=A0ABD0K6F9_9CAEN
MKLSPFKGETRQKMKTGELEPKQQNRVRMTRKKCETLDFSTDLGSAGFLFSVAFYSCYLALITDTRSDAYQPGVHAGNMSNKNNLKTIH